MRRKTAPILAIGATMISVASIMMAIASEVDAMLGWWMAIILLLPPLMWAFKTGFMALKTICLLTFTSQFITLPFFYIFRDDFIWGHVKPYGFTAVEAWPMLSKVMLFEISFIFLFILFYRLRLLGGAHNPQSTSLHLRLSKIKLRPFTDQNNQNSRVGRQSSFYNFLLILLVTTLVPLNLWMFSQGIGIVGVEPPRLPYSLTGFLHYMTKYIAPLLLAYLYWKTKRGFLQIALLIGYSLILGLSSVSRGTLMLVILPVLAAAWLDRRRVLLMFACLAAIIGVALVTLARNFVYIISAGKTEAFTENNILNIVFDILMDTDSGLTRGDFLFRAFIAIFERIEGFGNLVMSHFYDPYAVIGPLSMIFGMIWQGFAPVDLDLHHIQWQGNVLPEGFMNGGSLLSSVVIIGNANVLWIFPFALVAACILVLLEKSAYRVTALYGLSDLVAKLAIGMLSIFFFNGGGGGVTFVYPLLLLLVASWLPPLSFYWVKPLQQRFSHVPMHPASIGTYGDQPITRATK